MRRNLLALLAVALLATACSDDADPYDPPAPTAPDVEVDITQALDVAVFDGWTIEVQVLPARVGALSLASTPVEAAPRNDAAPWVEHELVFRNSGDRPLHFDDTRTSEFLGHRGSRALLAADEGCGYAILSPGAPLEAAACQSNLDAFLVTPRSSVKRKITLFKDLPRMKKLREGSYTFRKDIRFQVGDHGRKYEKVIKIRYLIQDGSGPAREWKVPESYRYEVASTCGERDFFGSFRINVRDGEVKKAEGLDRFGRASIEFAPTLEELLEQAEAIRDEGVADLVEIEYDPNDGHPTKIEIDYYTNGVDDEACYEITAYEEG